jgi:hypothetical protein
MKSLYIAWIATLVAFFLPLYAIASTGYQITRVAQSQSGGITGFDTFALNSAGQVGYSAFLANGSESVYRWTDGQTMQLAAEGDMYQGQPISVPGRMDLNDEGTVAFAARRFGTHNGATGIFRTDGNGLTKLAPLQPQSTYFISWVNLNDDGSATYAVQVSATSSIVAKSDGQTIQTIYSNGNWIPDFPRVNSSGDVVFDAFSGQAGHPYQGILVHNGTPTTFADSLQESNPRFDRVGGGNINNLGRVVFIGELHQQPSTLFNYENGQLTELIDPSQTAFAAADGLPGINDSGQLVFFGYLDSGQNGIFTGLNPVTDALVTTGQTLDSKTVSSVSIYGDINNGGQIVFQASFADGSSGLYLATPVPEPATALLCCCSTALFLCRAPRRLIRRMISTTA